VRSSTLKNADTLKLTDLRLIRTTDFRGKTLEILLACVLPAYCPKDNRTPTEFLKHLSSWKSKVYPPNT